MEQGSGSRTEKNVGGRSFTAWLPLIWNQPVDPDLCAKVRYDYMDVVTRAVERDFSCQIGDWCRNHGVQYIGHLIEDNNQHSRTGSSLGHYFRGLAGQDMAGIDNIVDKFFHARRRQAVSIQALEEEMVILSLCTWKAGCFRCCIGTIEKGAFYVRDFGAYTAGQRECSWRSICWIIFW